MRHVSSADVLPFERCPALWHATRVRRLDAGNRFTRIGAALHTACDAVTRAVLGEDSRELYLVARDAVTAHADAFNMDPGEMHEALEVMDAATASDSAISFYVPAGWSAVAEHELAIDGNFAPIHLWEGEDPTEFRGRLDRLQWNSDSGELEVWDWSASHDYLNAEELRLDVRARWDAMLALAWFPTAHTVTFKRIMLRLGYPVAATFVRGEKWHGQIQDRARRLRSATSHVLYTVGLANQMLEKRYTPPERYGKWCGGCPVRGQCKTWTEARETGRETWHPSSDRQLVARKLGAMKAAVAEIDEWLRADVVAHGPIPLGDGSSLGFFPHRGRTVRGSRDAALHELRLRGLDPERERTIFAPSDRAFPGCVAAAIEAVEPNRGMQREIADRLLAPATGFNFEVKETEET